MSNSNNGGALVGLIYLITIGISIGSGIMAWNWIDPDSFFGAIGFIIVWGILSKIGHFLAVLIVSALGGLD
jgi:NAD dependent epimerase/dehydratase family enzyme